MSLKSALISSSTLSFVNICGGLRFSAEWHTRVSARLESLRKISKRLILRKTIYL